MKVSEIEVGEYAIINPENLKENFSITDARYRMVPNKVYLILGVAVNHLNEVIVYNEENIIPESENKEAYFSSYNIIKTVTKEKDPEYFL